MITCYTASPLALEGCLNFRDLGGYSCASGKVTRKNRFYRADCLSKLTDRDVETLRVLGIRTVVDLRHDNELARGQNRLAGREDICYHHISLVDGFQSQDLKGPLPESLAKMYISLLDEAGAQLARIFRLLLTSPSAAVFHCAGGKDRTGVVAALLLLLAGVNEEMVIADYAVTYSLMKPFFDLQMAAAAGGADIPAYIFLSGPESMKAMLRHLDGVYGSAQAYLSAIGLDKAELTALKTELTEEAK